MFAEDEEAEASQKQKNRPEGVSRDKKPVPSISSNLKTNETQPSAFDKLLKEQLEAKRKLSEEAPEP